MRPFEGTAEQWSAYYDLQNAGLAYAIAYSETTGLFSMFSSKKRQALNDARDNYHEAFKKYSSLF